MNNQFQITDLAAQLAIKFNTEPFEGIVLGTLLLDETNYENIKGFLKPIMFSSVNTKLAELIFDILETEGVLKKHAILELAAQRNIAVTSQEIDKFRYEANEESFDESAFRIVKNWYAYNRAISALNLVQSIQNGIDVSIALSSFDKSNDDIECLKEDFEETKYDFSEQVTEVINQLVSNHQTDTVLRGVTSGFNDLDRIMGGFTGGNLYIIAGESGGGKSSLAIQIMNNVAVNTPTLFMSLEMNYKQIIPKMLSIKTGISTLAMRSNFCNETDLISIEAVGQTLKKCQFKIIDDTYNIQEIKKKITVEVKRNGTKIVFVDHLGIIDSNIKKGNNDAIYNEIAYELKRLAHKLDIPIVLLAQQNRSNITRGNRRPITQDLKYGGEAAADFIMFTFKPVISDDEQQKFNEETETEIVVTKNRETGLTGTLKRIFVNRFNALCEIDDNGLPILPIENTEQAQPKNPSNIITTRNKNIEDLPF